MDATTISKPSSLGAAALVLALVLAALGMLAWLQFRHMQAGADRAQASTTIVVIGDRCYVTPASCLGAAPVAVALLSPDAPISLPQDLALHAVEGPDGEALPAAPVLVPTPPPRSA